MTARINTVAFQGIDVIDIDVQVQIATGLPAFTIVGLPDKAVSEARERVRAALTAIGLSLPAKRLLVNMAPADVAKEGSHFDLAIALGVLSAMEVLPREDIDQFVVLGELALDGGVSPVAGVLPAAIHANGRGLGLICPQAAGSEAAWAGEMEIIAAESLLALVNHFNGRALIPPPERIQVSESADTPDFADVRGQQTARRAVEIAAAGGHNLLMVGPPGAGKSMLAQRMIGIMPELAPPEALETTMIHSIAGALDGAGLVRRRPYRAPHHSASMPALVGGGLKGKPGEMSLAHNGLLFLDELPEFPRQTLEALRQPLETGKVTIARANAHVTYPARVQVVAAMNPCRCGYLGDPEQACSKAPKCAEDYQNKLSGPLLDRFDIFVQLAALLPFELDRSQASGGESSAGIARRVASARTKQAGRYDPQTGMSLNAHSDGEVLTRTATPDQAGTDLLHQAATKMRLSARGYTRVLRVARTIADLAGAEQVGRPHVAEALSYRRLKPTG